MKDPVLIRVRTPSQRSRTCREAAFQLTEDGIIISWLSLPNMGSAWLHSFSASEGECKVSPHQAELVRFSTTSSPYSRTSYDIYISTNPKHTICRNLYENTAHTTTQKTRGFTQCCFKDGPASKTLKQNWVNYSMLGNVQLALSFLLLALQYTRWPHGWYTL